MAAVGSAAGSVCKKDKDRAVIDWFLAQIRARPTSASDQSCANGVDRKVSPPSGSGTQRGCEAFFGSSSEAPSSSYGHKSSGASLLRLVRAGLFGSQLSLRRNSILTRIFPGWVLAQLCTFRRLKREQDVEEYAQAPVRQQGVEVLGFLLPPGTRRGGQRPSDLEPGLRTSIVTLFSGRLSLDGFRQQFQSK